ncbi:MAG TPA: hypothetical protein VGQ77_13395, partial [Methylomirabilota bacterium]|nr:hypothetical protein [Methylomirabilota bacterium]
FRRYGLAIDEARFITSGQLLPEYFAHHGLALGDLSYMGGSGRPPSPPGERAAGEAAVALEWPSHRLATGSASRARSQGAWGCPEAPM